MNVFDYFFENTRELNKDFILGSRETLSYHDAYDKSLALAASIRENIGENKNVVLIGQNSVFFVIVYLAIFKSGNVCIPLNPEIEQETLKYILDLTGSELVFVTERLQEKLDFNGQTLVNEKDFHSIIESFSGIVDQPETSFDKDRLAEIIFTSGSTGEPKGVMISHKNIMANTDSILEYLNLTQDDVVEVVLPFFYCYGLSLFHTHLRIGGSVVLNNTFILIGSVINDLKKYKCTGFAGVPSHFQILLRKSQSFKSMDFPDLRYVTQAGGKLHNEFIQEFDEAFPDVKFFVMYGQTEATARLSFLPPDLVLEKLGSVGKAIPGVTLDVYDEKGNPVGVDEVGEIVARGDNIMSGYYKDVKGTNETLKNGWLHTGDLAKKDKDGFIYHTARKKEIIKVGGRRVSPKEIEAVILTVGDVVDCTINGVYDEVLGEALHAKIVITDKNREAEVKELIIQACSQRLASYKMPQVFEIEDKIRISSTGKKIKSKTG